ncbi:MAG: 3'-5' exonuclease [Verrucomicrobiota bacterium]
MDKESNILNAGNVEDVEESPAVEDVEDRPGFTRKMTREEIAELPIRKYSGPIHVVQTPENVVKAVEELSREEVIGFDTESRPAFKKEQKFLPSLIQLGGSRSVYIFQLEHVPLGEPLLGLLSNPGIIKTGVALGLDISQLNELAPFEAAGFIDLGDQAKASGIQNHGLRGLAGVLLGFRISKQAQRSNWSMKTLKRNQIDYAATDAWVGRELYYKFKEMGYLTEVE